MQITKTAPIYFLLLFCISFIKTSTTSNNKANFSQKMAIHNLIHPTNVKKPKFVCKTTENIIKGKKVTWWTCGCCGRVFSGLNSLIRHVRLQHKKDSVEAQAQPHLKHRTQAKVVQMVRIHQNDTSYSVFPVQPDTI